MIACFQDQFTNAAPLQGGIGMYLLQKMGWKQGEGLGKNNEGTKEPLILDFKVDRKGRNQRTELSIFLNLFTFLHLGRIQPLTLLVYLYHIYTWKS